MKKKILSLLVAFAMVVTMSSDLSVAYANPAGYNQDVIKNINGVKGINGINGKETPKYVEGEALVLYKPAKELKSFSKKKAKDIANLGSEFQIEQVWQFKDNAKSKNARKNLNAKGNKVKNPARVNGDLNIALIKSSKYSTKELISILGRNPAIKKAEPNNYLHISSYQNSYYDFQWGLENKGQNGGNAGIATNPKEKWNNPSSKESVVAIIDTGVDYNHPDLKNKMWKNTHFPDLKGKYGYNYAYYSDDPMDDNGHGSHCAGIIAGDHTNQIGIKGINPNVKIMALKFLGSEGDGETSAAVGAYYYIDRALDLGENITAINNSWGGGGYNYIIDALVTRVGEKGAVSCFASGNESTNVDDEMFGHVISPDNPYILTVNATNEKGQLATFSNYGRETTDIGAPGTDILSTVSYPCYNPTIYTDKKQQEVSHKFNNYETKGSLGSNDANDNFGVPQVDTFKSLEKTSTSTYKSEVVSSEYFGATAGSSLKLTFDNLLEGEFARVSVPYKREILKDPEDAPFVSVMIKGENQATAENGSMVYMVDVPKGQAPNDIFQCIELCEDGQGTISQVAGKQNYWNHMTFKTLHQKADDQLGLGSISKDKNAKNAGSNVDNKGNEAENKTINGNEEEREIVFCIFAGVAGKHTLYLDDFGLSKSSLDENKLEKYDFYNGTSMATPFVTGAVAMLGEEAKSEMVDSSKDLESMSAINYLLKHVKKDSNLGDSCQYSGTLDLTQKVDNGPRLVNVDTDFQNKKIILKGFGLGDPSISVKFNGAQVEILEQSDGKLVIKDQNWLNNIVEIEIAQGEKKIVKKNVYLVHSKEDYQVMGDFDFFSGIMAFATDGKYLFTVNTDTYDITKTNVKTGYQDILTTVPMEEYFDKSSNGEENVQCRFTSNLVCCDGKLYAVVEQMAASDVENDLGGFGSYSSKYRLISVDKNSGNTVNLGELPKELLQREDYSMAAYNGKIYFAGGYDYNLETVSTKVNVYDPKTKKWSNGPSLPNGRGAGIMVQTGNKLVYTLGYSKETQVWKEGEKTECPANLVLSGGSWKVVKAMKPFYQSGTLNKGGDMFNYYNAAVGVCKEGIVYGGLSSENLGDTFIFNVTTNKFKGLPYQRARYYRGDIFTGIAIGNYVYGTVFEESTLGFKINSGNVAVKAGKYKGGKILGANNYVTPGNQVKIKVVPKKGYKLKSLTIGGVKQNVSKATTKGIFVRLTSSKQAVAKFVK